MRRPRHHAARSATSWSMAMKGKTLSAAEKRFHNAVSSLGCIARRLDGRLNLLVSIHHIEGRAWSGAHLRLLPLRASRHQDGTGMPGLIAIHPWKRRFENRYDAQDKLLQRCHGLLAKAGAA
ncbi:MULTISPECIES: Ref family recombination enhancement nuclease [Pseudomonas]|uniref:Ref family recombination enhancement nuclease n=1 Tax=Pseudomonas TaxID=286 RepID=UPI002306AFDC|nr:MULTISPECIES: Ref family recombination enhancement nuclease [Pseudomonas]WCE10176.1 Ref family recombination enhancement nuclease [Pseudomonas sp. JBR1]